MALSVLRKKLRFERGAVAVISSLICLALAAAPLAAAAAPVDAPAQSAKKKKKRCKKAKKGTTSAKKKKKCKKKRKQPEVTTRVRASLAWSPNARDVDLIALSGGITTTLEGVGPPGAFGQYFGVHPTPPPIPNVTHSGDIAGGPETVTDLEAQSGRGLALVACVPYTDGSPVTLTLTVYDPPAFAPRVITEVADPINPGGGFALATSPAGGPFPGGDPCS